MTFYGTKDETLDYESDKVKKTHMNNMQNYDSEIFKKTHKTINKKQDTNNVTS